MGIDFNEKKKRWQKIGTKTKHFNLFLQMGTSDFYLKTWHSLKTKDSMHELWCIWIELQPPKLTFL